MKFPARERKNNEGSHNILKMISTTLKDVKRRRRNKKQKESLKGSLDCSHHSDSDASVPDENFTEPRSAAESIEIIEQKSQELLNEIQDALAKEKETTKSYKFHLDRARGRFEGHNAAGALISMRKLKQVQREQNHANDAIQFFSMRNLELVRFLKEIQTTKKQMADHDEMDDDTLYSTLAVQCAHLCESLTDIKSVLEEPNIEISTNAEDLLKELSVLLESGEVGDSSSDSDDDDESCFSDDEDLGFHDEDLLKELSSIVVAS
mmetsp:Transcript_17030/g.22186  ORF Transcript_17030/g.22186 Transcript_17030/m.22186 type:complete len:264 (+) Transcript_17030:115-906(+)